MKSFQNKNSNQNCFSQDTQKTENELMHLKLAYLFFFLKKKF